MENRAPTALSVLLRDLMKRKRYKGAPLAHAAGVSPSIIAKLLHGYDTRSGKPVQAKAETLQKIADALGEGLEEETARIYRDLMTAAGYMKGMGAAPPPQRLHAEPSKPPINVITRGVIDNPHIHPHIQRSILELLELSQEMDRQAGDGPGDAG